MAESHLLNSYLFLTNLTPGLARVISLFRLKQGGEDPNRVKERLGIPSANRKKGTLIWFHSASIGETLLVLSLIEKISKIYPNQNILLTTQTVSSGKMVTSKLTENVVHQYLPYDLLPGVRRFLNHWQPSVGILVESELWPILISEADHQNIPLLVINGKMTRKSFHRWRRFPKFTQALFSKINLFLVQSTEIKSRLSELGVNPIKQVVTGQLKQESKLLSHDPEELFNLNEYFQNRQVWVAASTHEGEEEIIAETHVRLSSDTSNNIQLILVPRYPERGREIAELLSTYGLNSVLRSKGELPGEPDIVYIADTMGELGLWYRLAKVSFIGGSLVHRGGHNPYEPALLGCPIIHGKYYENFSAEYEQLKEQGGSQMVTNSKELARAIERALDPQNGFSYISNAKILGQGENVAVDKTLDVIKSFIN
ncbi:MAG: 3-deoxy-D-manno-octulosonic acid transferase [Paracoccaceae bacterium]|nr:3-deoxy-D-manno-octulosonic acid transferase [Paracoccaceae bacterium]MDE2674578.1 3-deoxy-D-manno-octulosonic acid transferase [Paracoccaceae bacterium]